MSSVSVVIPALNEEENIAATLAAIPVKRLRQLGHDVEMLVVDNGSVDRTSEVARRHGARVLVQPVRGYGNAYQAGFANSTGDIIATGDADLTYPFEIIPDALEMMDRDRLDFLSTNRLVDVDPEAMSPSHIWANRILSGVSRFLHHNLPFRDSQSGMWIFRRAVWNRSRLVSGGMPFSQEIKLAAFRNGFRCGEMPIEYRPRGGEKKLRSLRDGALVAGHIVARRLRADWSRPVPLPAPVADLEAVENPSLLHPHRREALHRPTVSHRLTESHHAAEPHHGAGTGAEPHNVGEPTAESGCPNTKAQL